VTDRVLYSCQVVSWTHPKAYLGLCLWYHLANWAECRATRQELGLMFSDLTCLKACCTLVKPTWEELCTMC